jgi:hypothetical protein
VTIPTGEEIEQAWQDMGLAASDPSSHEQVRLMLAIGKHTRIQTCVSRLAGVFAQTLTVENTQTLASLVLGITVHGLLYGLHIADRRVAAAVSGWPPVTHVMDLPNFCGACGVYLMGGAIYHKEDCPLAAIFKTVLKRME